MGGRIAMLALAPEMPSLMNVLEGAGDAVPFERVRVLLRNADGTVAKDTMVDFPASADSISLTLTIPIPITAPDSGLPLALSMMYVNAAGDTVFRGGPTAIVARPIGSAGANIPVVIPVEFDGTGKDAASVVISPSTGTGVAGATSSFSATAFTAASAVIPNTPFLFYTLDSARAQVNAASGMVTWLPNRGSARIVAALPNGLRADTALFTVALPASKLELESGNAQTGSVLAPLADSIVLRTLASDDVPVEGVIVQFAVATGGGNVAVATDTSDADGRVMTRWTLGASLGAQSITATSVGLTGSPFTITATAVASTPARLEFTAVPTSGTAGAALSPALTVTARDAFGNIATSFTGNVTLAALGGNPPPLGGTLTRTAVAGVATFTDIVITQALSLELEATSGTLLSDTSATITIDAAAAAQLEFTEQPIGAIAGVSFAPAVTVTARDAFGNIATSFTDVVTMSLATGPTATLRGTIAQAAVAGVATFADLNIQEAGAGFSLSASATGLASATSNTFGITNALPSQLVIVSGDAQTASATSPLAAPLVVEVRDQFNNPVPGATVTFTVQSGGGSVLPTSALSDALGRAQTSWSLGSALGAQQVDASLAIAPAVIASFTATATVGAPAQLVITSAPTSGVATSTLSTVIAEVRDSLGNVVTSYTGAVDIALVTNPTAATLGGTLQRSAVAGVVTFNDLAITAAGIGYTLRATTVSESIVSDTTASFNVVAGAAAQFFIFSGNNQTGAAGTPFPQPLRVRVLDIHSNPLIGHPTQWSDGGVVTLTTVGTVLTDSLGIATNTAVFGTAVGPQSAGPFVSTTGLGGVSIFEHVVAPSTPDSLLLISGSGQSGLPLSTTANPLEVEVRDAFGNPIANVSVTFTIVSGDANTTVSPVLSDASGRATTEVVFGSAAGPVTVRATVAGVADTVNFSLTLLPGAPSVIAPLVGPQNRNAGELLNTVTYELRDTYGNKVTTFNGIARVQGRVPGLGAPLPNLIVSGDSVAVINGDIAFDSLRVDSVGTYDLLVTVDGGPSGTFGPFSITHADPSILLLVQGDAQSTPVTAPFAFPLRTRVTDAFGNGVPGVAVNYGLISGLANFPASANTDATGYAEVVVVADTLAGPIVVGAYAAGLTPDSVVFNLTATAGAPFALTASAGDAQTVAAGDTAAVEVVVVLRDEWGNLVPDATVSWGSADGVTFSAPSGVTDANGEIRTFVIAPGTLGTRGYFADAGNGVQALFTMTVEPGAAARLVITSAPSGGTAGVSLAPNVVAEVQDAFGNLIPSSTASITIAVDSSLTVAMVNGTTTIAATAGVVSFESLSLNTAGEYRLVATSPGLLPDTSAAFTLAAGAPTLMEIVSGNGQVGTVGGTLAAPMVVRLRDAFGNVVPGLPVAWSVSSGTAVVDSASYTTDAAGLSQMNLTFANTIEVVEVDATFGGLTQTFTVAAVAAAAAQLSVLAEPTAGTAGAPIAPVLTQALDPFTNIATSFVGDVTVSVDSGPAAAILSGTTTVTAVAGIATFSDLSFDLAGTYRLRFQSPGIADTTSAVFSIGASAASLVSIVSGDPQTDTVLAVTDTLLVRVTDSFGNGIDGASVVWAVESGDATLSYTESEADSLGYARAVVTFGTTPGVTEVSATHAALPNVTFNLNSIAGNATELSMFSATGSVPSPGTGAVVEVEVRDVHGNRVLNYAGTVSLGLLSGPDGGVLGGTVNVGVVDGIATFNAFTLDLIGSYTLQASGGGMTTADAIIEVTPGAPTNLAVFSGDNQSAFATLALESPLVVRLTDAVGNPIAGDTVVFVIGSGTGTFSNGFASDTSVTNVDGDASVQYTAGSSVGTETIDAVAGALPTVTFTVNVSALLGNAIWTGDASTLWTNPGNWRDGLIPTSADSAYFPAGRPGYPALDQPYTIGRIIVADGVTGFALGLYDLNVVGDIIAPQTAAFTSSGGSLVGAGAGARTLSGSLPALAIENGQYGVVSTALAPLTVSGALIVRTNARLVLDDADSVVVGGTFSTQSGGQLQQVVGSVLDVTGDINFAGGSTSGLLTGGVIRAGGNFNALGGSTSSFVADSAHVVQLVGAISSVNLGSPDLGTGGVCTAMCFGHLVADSLLGADSVTFLSGAKAVGGFDFQLPRLDAEGQHLVSVGPSLVRGDYTRISRYSFVDNFDYGLSFVVDTLVAGGTGVLPYINGIPLIVEGTRELQLVNAGPVIVEGTLDIDGPDARIVGELVTRGAGRLRMTDATDSLEVFGNATFGGSSVSGLLTAGELWVLGDLTVTGTNAFIADSAHTLVTGGAAGFLTPAMNIAFPATNPVGSLRLLNGTTLTIGNPGVTILGDVTISPTATVVSSGAPFTVAIAGVFTDSTGGRWQVPETVLQGTNAIQTTEFASEVYIAGPNSLSAPLNALGLLRVSGAFGALDLNGHTVTVSGNLLTQTGGRLVMDADEDTLIVFGNAGFIGGVSTLTAGRFLLHGTFDQNNGESFRGGPEFVMELVGAGAQQVGFANPGFGPGQSHFGRLLLSKPSGNVNVSTSVVVNGRIESTNPDQILAGAGQASEMVVRGASLSSVEFINQPLVIVGGDSIVELDSLSWSSMDAGITQLTLARNGNSFAISDAVFDSTASSPTYLAVEDSFADGDVLTVTMNNAAPFYHGNRINLQGGAVLLGWDAFEFVVWNNNGGAGDGQWESAVNWSTGFVPVATDSVYVPDGITPPTIATQRSVRALVSDNSLPIAVQAGLNVSSRLSVPTEWQGLVCTGSNTDLELINPTDSIRVRGSIACPFVAQGDVVAVGSVIVDSLLLTGGGTFSVEGEDVHVLGALLTEGTGSGLVMRDNVGILTVDGPSVFGSTPSSNDYLTDGTLVLRGSFSTTQATAFQPFPAHVTRIEGAGDRSIEFVTADSSGLGSHFGSLELGTAGSTTAVTLESDLYVNGVLYVNSIEQWLRNDGTSRHLVARGAAIGEATQLRMQGVPLHLAPGESVNSTLYRVRFDSMDPSTPQMEITRTDGAFSLSEFAFDSIVASPIYLSVMDADGGPVGDLQVTMLAPEPAFHFGRILTDGFAEIIDWNDEPSFIWSSTGSQIWTEPSNWSSNVVPNASADVVIPITDYMPTVPDGTTIRSLELLNIDNALSLDGVLTVNGNIISPLGSERGLACGSGARVVMDAQGETRNLRGSLHCLLQVVNGTVQVDGETEIDSLQVSATGVFDSHASNVSIAGELRVEDEGALQMTNVGNLTVDGPATFASALGDSTTMVGGTLTLRRGFTAFRPNALLASSTHQTVVGGCGTGGCALVTVWDTASVSFGGLEFENSNGNIEYRGAIDAASITLRDYAVLARMDGNPYGGIRSRSSVSGSNFTGLDASALWVRGTLAYDGPLTADTVVFDGTAQTIPSRNSVGDLIPYVHLRNRGTSTLDIADGDSLVVTGVMTIDAGNVNVGATGLTTLLAVGQLVTDSAATITQTEATSTIRADLAFFFGGSTNGLLTGGTLQMRGSLQQGAEFSPSSFRPTGSHTTHFLLNGVAAPISFQSAGNTSTTSGFAKLSFEGMQIDDTLRLLSDVYVSDSLIDLAGNLFSFFTNGPQRRLSARIGSLSGVRYNAVNLQLRNVDADITLDEQLFENQQLDLAQIDITGIGGTTVTASGFSYSNAPSTGNYLRLEGSGGGMFTFSATNFAPTLHSGNVQIVGDAALGGWDDFGANVWLGTVDSDWDNASNWFENRIAVAGDSLVLSETAANPLIADGVRSIGALRANSGHAGLQIQDTLIITRSMVAHLGPITCAPGGTIRHQNSEVLPQVTRITAPTCDFHIVSGTSNFQNTTAELNNVTIAGNGVMRLDGQAVNAAGSVITTDNARIEFSTDFAVLNVAGDVTLGGGSGNAGFEAGTMSVVGDFTVSGVNAGIYDATGTHRLVLGDSTNVSPPAGNIDVSESSSFANRVVLHSSRNVVGSFQIGGVLEARRETLSGGRVSVDSGLVIGSAASIISHTIALAGSFLDSGTFLVDTAEFRGRLDGAAQFVPARNVAFATIPYRVLRVSDGEVNLPTTGGYQIDSALIVTGFGSLIVGDTNPMSETTVLVIADSAILTVQDEGVLRMAGNTTMRVKDAIFAGGSSTGRLVNGTLQVNRNLFSSDGGDGALDTFVSSGSHHVILADSGRIQVSNPSLSRFNRVTLLPNTQLELASDIYIDGEFSRLTDTPGEIVLRADAINTVPPRRIYALGGTDFPTGYGRQTMRNVGLTLQDDFGAGGQSYEFSNFTFTDMDPDALYLDLTALTGYTITADSVQFATTATTGRYFDLTSGTVFFPNAVPSEGCFGAPEGCVGPRYEPQASQLNSFTGSVNADWTNAGNWTQLRVPLSYDDVEIPASASVTLNDPAMFFARSLSVAAGATLTIDGTQGGLEVRGNIAVASGGSVVGQFENARLDIRPPTATPITLSGGGAINDVRITILPPIAGVDSTISLDAGGITMNRSIEVTAGTFALNGNSLSVDSLITSGVGRLAMTQPSDFLVAGAAAVFGGASTEGLLTDGTLFLAGNFQQLSTTSPTSFAASGNHEVTLSNFFHTISFASPGAALSRFATLVTQGHFDVTLASDIHVTATLNTNGSANENLTIQSDDVPGTNRTITAGGFTNVTRFLTLSNVRMHWFGDPTSFQPGNFFNLSNMDPEVVQLEITAPSGTITLPSVNYTALSGGDGGRYLVVRDTVPLNGDLVVQVGVATPTGHGGFIDSVGTATIAGWDQFSLYEWDGSESGDPLDPANWAQNAVPLSNSLVSIPTSSPNEFSATTSLQYRDLNIAPGASATIAEPLTVTRYLYMNGSPTCTLNGELITGNGGNVGGTTSCRVRVPNGAATQTSGPTSLGAIIVEGNLFIGSDAFGGDELRVIDSLSVTATGSLLIPETIDSVTVEGLARLNGQVSALGTAARLYLFGDLFVGGNFDAPNAHFYMGNPDAPLTQTVRFTDQTGAIDSLTVVNSTLTIQDSLKVRRLFAMDDTYSSTVQSHVGGGVLVLGDSAAGIDGNLFAGETNEVNVSRLAVFGSLGTFTAFAVDTVDFLGISSASQQIPGSDDTGATINYSLVRVYGNAGISDERAFGAPAYTISGGLYILGNGLLQFAGVGADSTIVEVGGNGIEVNGAGARFDMTGALLRVATNDLHIEGAATSLGYGGVLEVNGNVSVVPTGVMQALFNADPYNHITRVLGSGTIDLGDTGGQTAFGVLELAGGDVHTLLNNAAAGQLRRVPGSVGTIELRSDNLAWGNTRGLLLDGVSLIGDDGATTFRNVAVWMRKDLDSPSPVFDFENVTFVDMDPTITQLILDFGGTGALSFSDITFATYPFSGRFLEVQNNFGHGSPTVSFLNTSPNIDCFLEASCEPGDAVPDLIPEFAAWEGGTSSDWHTASNWSSGQVPTHTTDIAIPPGTTNPLIINSNAVAGSVIVEPGAVVTISSSDTLDVFGNLQVDGTITGTDYTNAVRMRTGPPVTATLSAEGSIALPLILDALPGDIPGQVAASGNVNLDTLPAGFDGWRHGLWIPRGQFNVSGHTVRSLGGLRVTEFGRIEMAFANDSVDVLYNIVFSGASTAGLLTNGKLVARYGGFFVNNSITPTAFHATGDHQTIFTGDADSSIVSFDESGNTSSKFAQLIIDKPGSALGITSDSVYAEALIHNDGDIVIYDDRKLIVTGTISSFTADSIILGNVGSAVRIEGVNQQTCDFVSVSVSRYAGQFSPTSCHTTPLTWVSYTADQGTPANPVSTLDWNAIAAGSATKLVAVGNDGAFAFSFFDGPNWDQSIPSNTTEHLYAVSGVSENFWAVGANGTILSFLSGDTTTTVQTVGTQHLRAVLAISSDSVYAVGDAGTILFYDGFTWAAQPSGTLENLYGIAHTELDGIVAVGANGTWLTSSGDGTWTPVSSGTSTSLRTIVNVSATEYVVAGDAGVLRQRVTSTVNNLTASPAPMTESLLAGVQYQGKRLMLGTNGRVLQQMGLSWATIPGPSAETLRGATILDNTPAFFHIFAVGHNGTIYRAQLGVSP